MDIKVSIKDKFLKEVHFGNGQKIGEVEYDTDWNEWRFVRMENVRLSHHWLDDLTRYLRSLPKMR